MSTRQVLARLGAALLMNAPGYILLLLWPEFFHDHTWRLIGALALSWLITVPIFFLAMKYDPPDRSAK